MSGPLQIGKLPGPDRSHLQPQPPPPPAPIERERVERWLRSAGRGARSLPGSKSTG